MLCVVGVNLLVGTESGLMLLDRSGQGKVYPLINRRRFQQMDVLEGLNVLVTISGRVTEEWREGERGSERSIQRHTHKHNVTCATGHRKGDFHFCLSEIQNLCWKV